MTEEKPNESEMQEELVDRFEGRGLPKILEDIIDSEISVEVAKGTKIPYDIWLEPRDGLLNPRIQVRHFEQDVVFYTETDISEEDQLSFFNTTDSGIKVPLCIVEVKSSGMTTGTVLSYSAKAKEIKSLFPFSRYVVATGDKVKRKWKFHGDEFDAIHSLGDRHPDEWNLDNIEKELRHQFEKIASDIETFESRGPL